MSELLLQYEKVHPTTWVYLSSLLIIGLYFKFNRFWSVRNLDVMLLILFAPGLILVYLGQQEQFMAHGLDHETVEVNDEARAATGGSAVAPADGAVPAEGSVPLSPTKAGLANASVEDNGLASHADRLLLAEQLQQLGFIWLMVIGGLFLVRLLLDPNMVRRPLLEPNLSLGGLTFIGMSLFVFLVANVIIAGRSSSDPTTELVQIDGGDGRNNSQGTSLLAGPGYSLLERVPSVPTMPWRVDEVLSRDASDYQLSRLLVILAQLLIVLGMVMIGYLHFENLKTGIGAATLYLILPYTAQMAGRVDHALPSAMLVWSIVFYRRPLIAGGVLGLAACVYYPLFLIPLWISYYWQRGLIRFLLGVTASLSTLVLMLYFNSPSSEIFVGDVRRMFGLMVPRMDHLQGIWALGWDPAFRLPVMTTFFALSVTLSLWPAQKNLGTLMSCSAALLVATRFWNGNGGGLYMGWYLPLILVTVFRPNLEDRLAVTVLAPGWSRSRRTISPHD